MFLDSHVGPILRPSTAREFFASHTEVEGCNGHCSLIDVHGFDRLVDPSASVASTI